MVAIAKSCFIQEPKGYDRHMGGSGSSISLVGHGLGLGGNSGYRTNVHVMTAIVGTTVRFARRYFIYLL